MKTTRKTAALFLAFGAAATALAALAFVNNVSVVARWWAAFHAAGGDSARMTEAVSGVLPWLDWSAVDHSCVSTFIPMFGMFLATRGAWRVLRRRPADPESFPFFPSFDQLNVSLGLIGTLWGIIVIGWHDLDSVTMRDLMSCLHTALFSTLVAVAWVYLIDHPLLRPLLRGMLRDAGLDGAERDRLALDELLASLRDGARGLRDAWEGERGALEALQGAVGGVRAEAERFAESGARASGALGEALPRAADAFLSRLDAAAAGFESRQKAFEDGFLALSREMTELLEGLRAAQSAQAEAAAAAAKEAADLRLRLVAEAEAGNAVRAEAADLRGRVAEQARALDELREGLRAAEAALAREREDFSARWTELSGRKAELDARLAASERLCDERTARAERAEGLLSRIRSAFEPTK